MLDPWKSKGVAAPIFMAFGVTSSAPCLADVFVVCSFLFVTIWVAPENRAREQRTRGSTVLAQDSQGSQMVGPLTHSKGHQISCISRRSQRSKCLTLPDGLLRFWTHRPGYLPGRIPPDRSQVIPHFVFGSNRTISRNPTVY